MVPIAVFGAVALLLWVLCAMFLFKALAAGAGAERVVGEITGSRDFIDRGRTMYVAEFKAVVRDGRTVHGTGTFAKSWEPRVGAPIKLFYRSENASEPLVEAGPIRFITPAIIGAIAAAFSVFIVTAAVQAAQSSQQDDETNAGPDHAAKEPRAAKHRVPKAGKNR